MVETSHGHTFVRISGPAEAPPLVLLPGSASNSLMWATNIEALSADFRTYAVDNIYDIGRSVYVRHLQSADDFAIWLDELFTALGLGDRVNLMGASYGAWLASRYALRFPNRLAKMVLVAPAATVLPVALEFWIRAILSMIHRRLAVSFMQWIFADAARKDEASRRLMLEIMDEGRLAQRCYAPKKMIVPTTLTDEQLRRLKAPILYLVGEHEKVCSAKKAVRRLNKIAPQIKIEVIPGAGHDLTVVQADLVNAKVIEFLKQP